ncbi:pentapeptide repeat-containing protein [Streptomyces hilarionis]|uniref:pentapeptide repeat-containing protein n=1 Tax=Streptomyces hilarionis TaxID=2839954 RepID=UPI00211A11F2|nr:pentapeptide repeat-containing protein [Streptomyces hilarionis]
MRLTEGGGDLGGGTGLVLLREVVADQVDQRRLRRLGRLLAHGVLLGRARLSRTRLRGAGLRGAGLRGARLGGALLRAVRLHGCRLRGVRPGGVRLHGGPLAGGGLSCRTGGLRGGLLGLGPLTGARGGGRLLARRGHRDAPGGLRRFDGRGGAGRRRRRVDGLLDADQNAVVPFEGRQLLLESGDFGADPFLFLGVAFEVCGHLGGVLRGEFVGGGVLGHEAHDLSSTGAADERACPGRRTGGMSPRGPMLTGRAATRRGFGTVGEIVRTTGVNGSSSARPGQPVRIAAPLRRAGPATSPPRPRGGRATGA